MLKLAMTGGLVFKKKYTLNNPGRLGSVEIKTRTVSMSEDATVEEKEAKKGNNKKEKNKFQSGFKPQKGQKSEPNKEKGGGRAGTQVFPLHSAFVTIFTAPTCHGDPILSKMGTQWGPNLESDGDLMGTSASRNGDPKAYF